MPRRSGRTPSDEIIAAVAKMHSGNFTVTAGTLAGLGIKTTAATVHDVLIARPGALSMRAENHWRQALQMPLLSVPTLPCPSCGQSHNLDETGKPLDCHNQTGQAVWRIVTPPRPPAPPRRRIDITALTPAQQDEVKALVESFKLRRQLLLATE